MKYTFQPLDSYHASDILGWRYLAPYDFYNFNDADYAVDLSYLLNPQNAFWAILNADKILEGYCSFGPDGQVAGGDYRRPALDIGMGIRPSLTGKGRGKSYAKATVEHAIGHYRAAALRVTIAAFNQRALKVWSSVGFIPAEKFTKTNSQANFLILVLSTGYIG